MNHKKKVLSEIAKLEKDLKKTLKITSSLRKVINKLPNRQINAMSPEEKLVIPVDKALAKVYDSLADFDFRYENIETAFYGE